MTRALLHLQKSSIWLTPSQWQGRLASPSFKSAFPPLFENHDLWGQKTQWQQNWRVHLSTEGSELGILACLEIELFVQGEGKGELSCMRSKIDYLHQHSVLQNNESPANKADINKTMFVASLQNKIFSPRTELIVIGISKMHSHFCSSVIYSSY